MKKLMNIKVKAFTLVEMLFTLVIISILLLLFVPNFSKQKEEVKKVGGSAIIKVVESQAELYELNNAGGATVSKLVETGYISDKQGEAYQEHYANHLKKNPKVGP